MFIKIDDNLFKNNENKLQLLKNLVKKLPSENKKNLEASSGHAWTPTYLDNIIYDD